MKAVGTGVDSSLNFDVYSRLSTICEVLADLPAGSLVLDVGGHPGLLARSLPDRLRVVTCDLPCAGDGVYVCGSGNRLPFASSCVDAVVISDVLEHVPTAGREDFLAELMRVSRDLVVVSGPWSTPGVAFAEECVVKLRETAGVQHDRWLDEHLEYGLPTIRDAWEQMSRGGMSCRLQTENDLQQWFCLFAGEILTGLLPGADVCWQEFMPQLNKELLSCGNPAYRHVLVSCQGDAVEWCDPYSDEEYVLAADRIRVLHGMFAGMAKALRESLKSQGSGAELAYIRQLETALAAQRNLSLLGRLKRKLWSGRA